MQRVRTRTIPSEKCIVKHNLKDTSVLPFSCVMDVESSPVAICPKCHTDVTVAYCLGQIAFPLWGTLGQSHLFSENWKIWTKTNIEKVQNWKILLFGNMGNRNRNASDSCFGSIENKEAQLVAEPGDNVMRRQSQT